MIELFQHKKVETTINYYSKIEPIKIILDKNIIQSDIERLNVYLENTENKFNKENIKALLKYLNKLLKYNTLDICWSIKDDIPHSYPIELIDEELYNISTCNYIEIEKNKNLVEIDLKELNDIIAFEIMHEDLGENLKSMEEKLFNCSILGFEDSKIITDIIKDNNKDSKESIYTLSKKLKIGETAYYSASDKVAYDYFLNKQFKDKKYKNVVEYSCRYASAIIINSILKNAHKFKEDIRPIMINSHKIIFLTSTNSIDKLKEKILDDISIRTFGRQFIVKPKISII